MSGVSSSLVQGIDEYDAAGSITNIADSGGNKGPCGNSNPVDCLGPNGLKPETFGMLYQCGSDSTIPAWPADMTLSCLR
ncbi:hypothetical protein [Kitasatospora sp. NPDC092286]|uniref:hypothetical protein n=1 Tax=Kitasatospora sp. NPDC092286 TaxID=3364087 RepID=UPI0037FCBB31